MFQAACDWAVPRIGIASTIGVYGGAAGDGPIRENLPLSMMAGHVIPAFKKIGELVADHLASAQDRDCQLPAVGLGPLGNPM